MCEPRTSDGTAARDATAITARAAGAAAEPGHERGSSGGRLRYADHHTARWIDALVGRYNSNPATVEPILAVDYEREADVGGLLAIQERGGSTRWQGTRNTGHELDEVTTDSTLYTIEHDAVGRVTEGAGSTYVYGPRGRLMRATGTIAPIVREEYLYDADGRLAHVLNGKSRTIVHDGEELIAAIDDQGLPIWESVPGAFTNQLLEYQRENLERMIPVTDHRHSIVGWWNASLRQMDTTIEYTPLGRLQIFSADGSVICTEEGIGADCARIVPRFGFGSAYHTEFTGLVYMRNRWYSPKLGQFLTQDPLGYVDGYNPWAYAVFDPINFWDPFGLESRSFVPCPRCAYGSGFGAPKPAFPAPRAEPIMSDEDLDRALEGPLPFLPVPLLDHAIALRDGERAISEPSLDNLGALLGSIAGAALPALPAIGPWIRNWKPFGGLDALKGIPGVDLSAMFRFSFTRAGADAAMTGMANQGGHAIRHFIKDGFIKDQGSLASKVRRFQTLLAQSSRTRPHRPMAHGRGRRTRLHWRNRRYDRRDRRGDGRQVCWQGARGNQAGFPATGNDAVEVTLETIVDWLRADGTSRYEILMHAYFRSADAKGDAKQNVQAMFGNEFHAVYDYEEGVHSLLTEFRTHAREEVGALILRALRSICAMPEVIGAFCVLDGQYGGLAESFVDDKWAPHGLYAFCLADDEPVLTLSVSTFRGPGWKELILGDLRTGMDFRPR